jgi:hypothetical protein
LNPLLGYIAFILERRLFFNKLLYNVDLGLFSTKYAPLLTLYSTSIPATEIFLEETGVPGENHRPTASRCQPLSYTAVSDDLNGFKGTKYCRI